MFPGSGCHLGTAVGGHSASQDSAFPGVAGTQGRGRGVAGVGAPESRPGRGAAAAAAAAVGAAGAVGDVRRQEEEEAGAQEVGAWDRAGRAKTGQREPGWLWEVPGAALVRALGEPKRAARLGYSVLIGVN